MEKISERNTITPKKVRMASWAFTVHEGGRLEKFIFPESVNAYDRMRKLLTNRDNWGRYEGPNPYGPGSRSYTRVIILPEFGEVKVHSLFFPDGTVWDSTLRSFRNIRDYELKS